MLEIGSFSIIGANFTTPFISIWLVIVDYALIIHVVFDHGDKTFANMLTPSIKVGKFCNS